MRVIRGTVNAILMVTLVKPMVRLTVGRWRKRVQESPAASLGIPMQELLETALLEELAPQVTELELVPADLDEPEAGRSRLRLLLLAGLAIAVVTATTYAVAGYLQRRREAQAKERELVAVPIETPAPETVEDMAQEALAD